MILCDTDEAGPIVEHLGCPIVELPNTYLGIPLTFRRPTAAQLQPVVDKAACKLPTWKIKLMNKAVRLAFVKSVLCAIPRHQLLVLAPPKRVIKLLEKVQLGFLWAGRAEANGGSCHANWRRVCRPTSLGVLGVPDLERTSLALRTGWLWFSRVDDDRAWSGLDLQFTAEERDFFFASTTMTVGNGQHALFWEDRWIEGHSIAKLAPLLYNCIPKRRRKVRTVADGLQAHRWANTCFSGSGPRPVSTLRIRRTWLPSKALSPAAPGSSRGNAGRRREYVSSIGSPSSTDAGRRTT